MQIREGAYYRTRGGDVVGPMACYAGCDNTFMAVGSTWNEDGSYFDHVPYRLDLISEVYVSDTPPDAPSFIHPAPDGPSGPFLTVPETKTLRDEFVMRLMDRDMFAVGFIDEAEQLYRVADAMMEARKK
jgi:hypothetical protein